MKNIVIGIVFCLIISNLVGSCGKNQKVIDCSLVYGTLVDPRDGSRYSTVTVCDDVWMTQNLRYEVPGVVKDPISLGVEYGVLYNYEQANGACPEGWHLATDEDWKNLEKAIGVTTEELNKTGWRGEEAGEYLKSSTQWQKGKKTYTPISFRVLPAGYSDGTYQGLKEKTRFWTATEAGAESAWVRELAIDNKKINRSEGKKSDYNSCRCVLN